MAKNYTKEELRKQLNAIEKKETQELITMYYPEFKKLEGRYFKTRNSYSCPEKPSDYWWLYTKVVSIKPNDVYDTLGNGVSSHYSGWSFQTDKYKNISIENKRRGYVHSLGQEITEREFNEAWNKMITKLNNL